MRKLSLLAVGVLCWPLLVATDARAEDKAQAIPSTAEVTKPAIAVGEPHPHGKFKDLSPEERAAKKAEMKAKWEAMSPEDRAAKKKEMRARHKAKWEAMTPEQREAKKAKMKERWDNLTPEQKAKFKENHPNAGKRFKEHRQKAQ